jgi:hypothetical protein
LFLGENAIGIAWILLLNLHFQLVATADVFRARNDLVIDSGNYLLDDRICR